jgi:GR25 family glycosyltransferase involved in LPS biosynthesis
MRVGITADLRYSLFSAGHGNACFSIAKILEAMKYQVVFIHRKEDGDWWDDVESLKEGAPKRVFLGDFLSGIEGPLDLVIEVAFNLKPEERHKVGKWTVWYNRRPSLFSDIESTVYANRPEGRNLEGVSAIWVADLFTTNDDIVYLQTLYPSIPVEIVPWIWTPDIVEAYRRQTQAPAWPQVYGIVEKDKPWSVHISETNASSTSSCTLPLVILRHAQLSKRIPLSQILVHNTEILKDNKFFNENVLRHSKVDGISYNLLGRQRVIDWVHDPHSVILSHSRFVDLKMANLEAAWVGIPVLHNSEVLRSFGTGLEHLFYQKNSVGGAVDALHTLVTEPDKVAYATTLDGLSELRKKIVDRFYPLMKAQEWSAAVLRVFERAVIVPLAVKAPVAAPVAVPIAVPVAVQSMSGSPTEFSVLFTDMWDQFNEAHNMFILAIETALKSKSIKVVGYNLEGLGNKVPNLTVFGPFGDTWKTLDKSWPKVHFTGENTPPIMDPSVKLNIGYMLPDISDQSYLRMPLWMFEIDWFGAELDHIRNPLPLPVDTCTKVNPDDYSTRTKFCSFVVTNPTNPIRNQAFMTLNSYKPVDSAGRLYNNVGDVIFAGLGGGGGELKKHNFLKQYRFNLCYENASTPGYTTEKILHAKAAGCIPIYWGDQKVGRDFNEKGFINAYNCKTGADLIKLVDEIESNPAKWREMASVPALSGYSRDLVRRTFSEMVKRFLVFGGREDLIKDLPPFIGAKTTEEAETLRKQRAYSAPRLTNSVSNTVEATTSEATSTRNAVKPLFVTTATQRFWPFLVMWLNSVKAHGMTARVYVGNDVSDSGLNLTMEKFKDMAEFIRLPTTCPEGFNDFWDPKHYGWKLWVYKTVVNDESLNGRLIFYIDAGAVLLRMPGEWVHHAIQNGVSFLEDSQQKNKYWCHETFCQLLKVTNEEKEGQQILAGLSLFIAGHPVAKQLFNDAYRLAEDPDILVGEKWDGFYADGHPKGHRHDQSILSILTSRMRVHRYPFDKVYGDKSARATFHGGQCIYVHRGNFKSHEPLLEGIDDAFVINLDRREDRKKAFLEFHPYLKGHVRRLPAYDGRKLTLGPLVTRLFKTNDFFWKKAVMGCALSHLKLWNMLISEPAEIQSFLILEDDARLSPEWRNAWNIAYKSLPAEWDCVYLGGVLPPNRAGFVNTLERVGPGLAKVAPNKMFGQPEPTSYFHFCAYAYVLSRRGAEKILGSILERDGYWTSADHMVCNRVDTMKLYVLDPLVAGASQDDDPMYKSAQFNNFSRIDNFDSDLWNNDERFTPEEIQAQMAKSAPLSMFEALDEVDSMVRALQAPVAAQEPKPQEPKPQEPKPLELIKGTHFFSLDLCQVSYTSIYEANWLQDLFQKQKFSIKQVSITDTLKEYEHIVLIVIKTRWNEQLTWLESLANAGRTFKVIHLADEFLTDPIHFYSWQSVTGVLRFYPRSDIPAEVANKVLTVPLGYHRQYKGNRDLPHISTPELPFRELMWSFAGTDWKNRSSDMLILDAIQPRFVKWFSDWNDAAQLKEDEYLALMLNSKFVPCPPGQNVETYRFYEALACGSIPMFIDSPQNATWLQLFNNEIPFLKLPSWNDAAAIMHHFKENPDQMEKYRKTILISWANYKKRLENKVSAWLLNGTKN